MKLKDWSRKGRGSQRSIIFNEIEFGRVKSVINGRSQGWAWEAIERGVFEMQQRNREAERKRKKVGSSKGKVGCTFLASKPVLHSCVQM
jgi:hypothetical protein